MRFINKVLIWFLLPTSSFGLSELKTKQDITKIRYLSNNGTVTYYQKTSGELQMSTNYNFKNVFKGSKNTEYKVIGSKKEHRILFSVDEQFFPMQNALKDNPIYVVDLKAKNEAKLIGLGSNPSLHFNDQFASFYNHKNKEIVIYNFANPSSPRNIKLNKPFPYFNSSQIMITPNDIIYTDVNRNGTQAVLLYSLVENKFQTIHKSSSPSNKLEICEIDNKLYIGEFPQTQYRIESQIIEVPLFNNKNYLNKSIIYSSKLPDLGQLTCNEKELFFLKTQNYSKKLNLFKADIAKIDLNKKETIILTNEGDFDQIIQLGHLTLGYRSAKYFIIAGKANAFSDEIKKALK